MKEKINRGVKKKIDKMKIKHIIKNGDPDKLTFLETDCSCACKSVFCDCVNCASNVDMLRLNSDTAFAEASSNVD
jgi:hypothetical protein